MSEYYQNSSWDGVKKAAKIKFMKSPYFHLLLFFVTFATTFIAGMEWSTGRPAPYTVTDFPGGIQYAVAILFVLGFHEFGHYFAARFHKVNTTLPYFIPFPPIPFFLNFGTLGAVIKTREPIKTNKAMFDIGVFGPISGFVACIILLVYGFTHLPGQEYLLAIHPDYFASTYGENALSLEFGNTLIFSFLRDVFTTSGDFVPPMTEIYHYPLLCVGWFGLFVTAMNMLPVGQLDGGHVVYSMFGGKIHNHVSAITLIAITIIGVGGIFSGILQTEISFGWSGWLFWALILYFVIKIKHPPVPYFEPLDTTRLALGWLSILILLLSFSPTPFVISIYESIQLSD